MTRLTLAALALSVIPLAGCGDGGAVVAPPRTLAPAARVTALQADAGTIVMSGLANPRGLSFGVDGSLYVAEAGRGGAGPCFSNFGNVCYGPTGAVSRLADGVQERLVDDLPSYAQVNSGRAEGPNAVSLQGVGNAYVTIGLESDPAVLRAPGQPEVWRQFARLVRLAPSSLAPGIGRSHSKKSWEFVADLGQYEIDVNPDCGDTDSNPFGVLAEPSGVIVADAGANAFVRMAANGDLSTVAVFSNNTTIAGPGCPPAATRDFVPTSIVTGPDGAYYLGHLNGLPISQGSSSVWRMEAGGVPQPYLTGFTWILALAFDADGNLYVLQHSDGATTSAPGSLVRVPPGGTPAKLVTGIPRPGGLAVGPDGAVYISQIPGLNYKEKGIVRRYVF